MVLYPHSINPMNNGSKLSNEHVLHRLVSSVKKHEELPPLVQQSPLQASKSLRLLAGITG